MRFNFCPNENVGGVFGNNTASNFTHDVGSPGESLRYPLKKPKFSGGTLTKMRQPLMQFIAP